jgi:hypothetical protein
MLPYESLYLSVIWLDALNTVWADICSVALLTQKKFPHNFHLLHCCQFCVHFTIQMYFNISESLPWEYCTFVEHYNPEYIRCTCSVYVDFCLLVLFSVYIVNYAMCNHFIRSSDRKNCIYNRFKFVVSVLFVVLVHLNIKNYIVFYVSLEGSIN